MIDPNSLDPGERILWHDSPDVATYCRHRKSIGFSIGAVLLAIGSALAGYALINGSSDSISNYWPLPVLLGGALLYLPFRTRRAARRTRYALTDRRAIIETPGVLLRNRVSVPLAEVRLLETRRGPFGDLLFRDFVGESGHGFDVTRDGFFAIANVERVEQLFRSAVEKATGRPLAGRMI